MTDASAEANATALVTATRDILNAQGIDAFLMSTGGNCTALVFEPTPGWEVVFTDLGPSEILLSLSVLDEDGESTGFVHGDSYTTLKRIEELPDEVSPEEAATRFASLVETAQQEDSES